VKLFKLWLPAAVWAGLIFYFSSIPDLKSGLEYDFIFRKLAHVLEYFVLTFLLWRAFKGTFSMGPVRRLVYPATAALVYAVLDEIHQYFVPGRSGNFNDCLIDALGIFGFLVLIKLMPRAANRLPGRV